MGRLCKGIGIILVVFGHVNRGLYSAGIQLPGSFYQLTDSVIYSFHMPLFSSFQVCFYAVAGEKGQNSLRHQQDRYHRLPLRDLVAAARLGGGLIVTLHQ